MQGTLREKLFILIPFLPKQRKKINVWRRYLETHTEITNKVPSVECVCPTRDINKPDIWRPFCNTIHAIIFMTVLFLLSFTVLSTSASFLHTASQQEHPQKWQTFQTTDITNKSRYPQENPFGIRFAHPVTCFLHIIQWSCHAFAYHGTVSTLANIQHKKAQAYIM